MNIAQTIPIADTWGMHGDIGAGWAILMMSLMVLFWSAVVVGIVWLVRGTAHRGSTLSPALGNRESPMDILERRLAEGAITPEEYRTRRDELVQGTPQSEGMRNEEQLTAPATIGGRVR